MTKSVLSAAGYRALLGLGIGLGLTVILTVIYMYEHGPKNVAEESEQHEIAPKAAPRFSLKDVAGKSYSLDELKGNAVILHFWASWCPPCIDEIPLMVDLSRRLQGRPVKILMVSLDASWADAHKILPSKGLPENMISVLDESAKLPDQYGSYQFPETYLLNSNLEIITKWVGSQVWSSAPVQAAIDRAMPSSTTAPTGTAPAPAVQRK